MNVKACRDTRLQIDELDLGQQPNQQTAAHLAICSDCKQFMRERAGLRDLLGSLETVAAPADFDMRVRARIAAQRGTGWQRPFFARFIGMPAIVTAALVVMVVGAIVWMSQRNAIQPTKIATGISSGQQPTSPVATGPTKETASVTSPAAADSDIEPDDQVVPVQGKQRTGRSGRSKDFSLLEARSIKANDPNQAFVNAPSRRVEVSLEDESGATRKISLPPVSFGAQKLVDNRTPVIYSANSRVW